MKKACYESSLLFHFKKKILYLNDKKITHLLAIKNYQRIKIKSKSKMLIFSLPETTRKSLSGER